MTRPYRLIHWNGQKAIYDAGIVVLLLLGAACFSIVSKATSPQISNGVLFLRSTAWLGFFLLHVLLCIGPLTRMSPRFYPLLYNRRHLGVVVFLLALAHGMAALVQLQGPGGLQSLAHLFTAYAHEYHEVLSDPRALRHIPFEPFGIFALVLLFCLAATSHDFWLQLLGPRAWKSLHLFAYPAYAFVVLYLAFGLLQAEQQLPFYALVLAGVAVVAGLHLAAYVWGPSPKNVAVREDGGFVTVCDSRDLVEGQGLQVVLNRQPVALFRVAGRVYALSGTCPKQGAPIGEGRVIDGMVTCPWHGCQYGYTDGANAQPGLDSLATYPVKIQGDSIRVATEPHTLGTANEGALLSGSASRIEPSLIKDADERFYVGHRGYVRESAQTFSQAVAGALIFLAVGYMAVAAAAHRNIDVGTHMKGETFTYRGIYTDHPLPSIFVHPGSPGSENSAGFHMLISGQDARPLPDSWREAAGKMVQIQASPIYRENVVLLDVPYRTEPTVLGEPSPGATPREPEAMGYAAFQGELVDTRCYLGATRPGTGKLHRVCAIRCLEAGGLPGVRVASGDHETVVLMAPAGEGALAYHPEWAGRSISVEGQVFRTTSYQYIRADSIALLSE